MSVAVQQSLAASGSVFFERCLVSVQPGFKATVPFATLAAQIRAVGVATTLAATDYGLPQLPTPADGLRDYAARLLAAGFSVTECRAMLCENPARLLRLA
jgi:hypothetical protein